MYFPSFCFLLLVELIDLFNIKTGKSSRSKDPCDTQALGFGQQAGHWQQLCHLSLHFPLLGCICLPQLLCGMSYLSNVKEIDAKKVIKMLKLLRSHFPNRLEFVTPYLYSSAALSFYHLPDGHCQVHHFKYFILETCQNQPSKIRTQCVLVEISGSFSIYSLEKGYHPISLWLDSW